MEARLRAGLTHIVSNLRNPEENSAARLKGLFDELTRADPNSDDRLSAALHVLFAEAAVRCGAADMAAECLRLYYNLHAPKDQFQIRALCVRAQLEARRASGMRGEVRRMSRFFCDSAALCTLHFTFKIQDF